MKARPMKSFEHDQGREIQSIWIECPGCNMNHRMPIEGNHPRWSFNGDFEKPTFTPSIHYKTEGKTVCHSFIADGKIQFLNDSTHALTGQTVDLPDVDD